MKIKNNIYHLSNQFLELYKYAFFTFIYCFNLFDMMAESNLYKAGSTGKKLLSAGVIMGIILFKYPFPINNRGDFRLIFI